MIRLSPSQAPLSCISEMHPGSNFRLVTALAALSIVATSALAQIADQVVLFGQDPAHFDVIARFDRKLGLVSVTQVSLSGAGAGTLDFKEGFSVHGQGIYAAPFDALNDTKVLRMQSDGELILPSVNLQHNPVRLAPATSGMTYVLTRIPLLSPGPLYAVSAAGSVLWSSWQAPVLFTFYPSLIVMSPAGEVWLGGGGIGPLGWSIPLLVQVNPANGAVLTKKIYFTDSMTNISMMSLAVSPDGSFWAFQPSALMHMVNLVLVKSGAPIGVASTQLLRVDATGNPMTLGGVIQGPGGDYKTKVMRYDATTFALLGEYSMGGEVTGFALGPSGEDVYASIAVLTPPDFPKRLVRLNLVTGVKSSIGLGYLPFEADIPYDDPTGFIWANVTDQQGDADGDGAANRAETMAGSDPFDATSRPEGPKVYISFAPTTNALVLTYVDPDGLLDPVGGLDLATLSVTIGNFGNVFWLLAPFATALDLTPDMTKATLTFGALPLPFDKKWQVEARIADLTGATAWDWQVTPPGDL